MASISRIGRDTAKIVDFIRTHGDCVVRVYSPLEGELQPQINPLSTLELQWEEPIDVRSRGLLL